MSDVGPGSFGRSQSATSEFIKNARQRRYPKTFRELISRKMDDYFEYMAQDEYIRAFANFYLVLQYVQQDKQGRVFWKDFETKEVDDKKKAEFETLSEDFEVLYGTKPASVVCAKCKKKVITGDKKMAEITEAATAHARDNPGHTDFDHFISYQELRTRQFPDAKEDKVSIGKYVPFQELWGDYLPIYTYLKTGYYVKEVITKPDGFVTTMKTALILPDDPNLDKYLTNWIPYAFWEEQERKLRVKILALLVQLENYVREYLHKEIQWDREHGETSAAPITDIDGIDDDESNDADSDEVRIVDAGYTGDENAGTGGAGIN